MLTAADRHDVHRSGEGHAARLRLQCGVTRAELAVRAVAAGVGFTAAQQEGRVPPAARGLHHTLLHQPRLQPGRAYGLALVRQAALAVLRRAGAVGEALGVLGPLGGGQRCGLGRPGLLGSWRGEGCRHCLGAGVERDRRCPRFRFEFRIWDGGWEALADVVGKSQAAARAITPTYTNSSSWTGASSLPSK